MNRTSTIKSAFILFFILTSTLSLKAQSNTTPVRDTSKVIIVVTPGQNYQRSNNTTTSPAKDTTNSHVIQPIQTTTPVPTTTNQTTTAPATGQTTTTPAATTPTPQQTPGRAMNPKKVYVAPTTAERTGTAQYLPPVVKPVTTPTTTTPPASTPPAAVNPVVKPAPLVAATDTAKSKKDTIIINGGKKEQGPNAQAAFIEVGGPGLAITGNYDTRILGKRDGWGYRIGAGYFGSGGNTVFTVPIQINYLLGIGGSDRNYFEFGAGTTFLNSNGDNKGKFWEFDRVTGFIATGTLGYRYQSPDSRLNLRIGFVPIIYDEGLIPAGGLSVGYTFP
jgi:hypothetical protein